MELQRSRRLAFGDAREGAQVAQADSYRFQLQRADRFRPGTVFADHPLTCVVEHIDPMIDESARARRGTLEALRQRLPQRSI